MDQKEVVSRMDMTDSDRQNDCNQCLIESPEKTKETETDISIKVIGKVSVINGQQITEERKAFVEKVMSSAFNQLKTNSELLAHISHEMNDSNHLGQPWECVVGTQFAITCLVFKGFRIDNKSEDKTVFIFKCKEKLTLLGKFKNKCFNRLSISEALNDCNQSFTESPPKSNESQNQISIKAIGKGSDNTGKQSDEELEAFVMQVTSSAFNQLKTNNELMSYISHEMNSSQKYGNYWHCVVGNDFAITCHLFKGFIIENKSEDKTVFLFKSKQKSFLLESLRNLKNKSPKK